MIYLIDDKKLRQKDFGWTEERFNQYAGCLTPLYNIDDVTEIGEKLYYNENVILYHESFLDFSGDRDKALEQRNKLTEKVANIDGLSVAFFSGSQSSRSLDKNIAHLPVAILYQNLETLIEQHIKGEGNLRYLLFGENPDIEEELNEILTHENRKLEIDAVVIPGKNLFIRPNSRFIQNAIEGAIEGKIFNDVSDEKLSEKINEWLIETEFDNIFIPLCFGQTLSDYNGLRLAIHIRCTPTLNQLKKIFIYGFVGIEYLFQNEYFNILKTKNVELVNYSKTAFQKFASVGYTVMKLAEVPGEISKLKLNPPKNYSDNHSITNEWAINQWAKTIGCDATDELMKISQNVESNLYFKYLRTIHPICDVDKISPEKLKINLEGKPKVLLIDDEAEKGWYEIFACLLGDFNDIYTDYLGEDFRNSSCEDVIHQSIDKIKTDNIDVVILDFRLNSADFNNFNINNITSVKLLREIKNLNPGIQVIVFSATNKVWNLQALQEAGADGFLIKEAPENNRDYQFTTKLILKFVNLFSDVTRKIFLKNFYRNLLQAEKNIADCDYEDESNFEIFLRELRTQIKITKQASRQFNYNLSITLDVIFLNCYNFLEMFKNHYLLEKEYRFYLGIEEVPLNRYQYIKGSIKQEEEFIRNSGYDSPSWFQVTVGLLVDYFKVVNHDDPTIEYLWKVKNWRNEYIHENKSFFSQEELLKIADLMVKVTSSIKE